jgi:hypothetical protein
MTNELASFELWQDGQKVAGCQGPRERAEAQIAHYAMMYGEDGPVEIKEIKMKGQP